VTAQVTFEILFDQWDLSLRIPAAVAEIRLITFHDSAKKEMLITFKAN
jgi:hypothetical protein